VTSPRRYTTLPFPRYRHVPGKTPHPTRSPAGHSYGHTAAPFTVDAASWRTSEPYLHAIDLFNHGYYWEAHEALEALWHGAGHETPIGRLARALIQASAALLKHSMGEREPAERLVRKAAAKLRALPPVCLGVSTHALADALEKTVAGARDTAPIIDLRDARASA
jgi:predicted metal-dependent hydrolase